MASVATSTAPLSPHSFPLATHVQDEPSTLASENRKRDFAIDFDLHMPLTPPFSDDEHDRHSMSSSEPDSGSCCSPSDDEARVLLDDLADRHRAELPPPVVFERKMGETEVSYFLPSRADGVNDMCVSRFSSAPALI